MTDRVTPSTDDTIALGAVVRARPIDRGATIGRYIVLDRIGHGGMGVVYAAYDPELDRKIAVKLLHQRIEGSQSDDHRRRMIREAQAMARVSHPNVIAVHDVGQHEERVFLAMEFVDGTTLGEWMRSEPRARAQILATFLQAGEGLAAAHARELVHRDFKPDNVMVGSDGRVRVMDFGLARDAGTEPEAGVREGSPVTDALTSDLTRAGSILGTPAYMAPEQHLGLSVDARTDQFSFCVALYEALYGDRPFGGETLAALTIAVTSCEIRSAPKSTDVPGWLRKVLLRGLAADPNDRHPDMRALLHAIARDPSRARRRRIGLAAVAVVAASVPAIAMVQSSQRRAACDAQAGAIETVWNEGAAATLRQAFDATGSTEAADTHARVVPFLAAYASDWTRMRGELCRDGERELDSNTRALANACFDERQVQLAALVTALSEPTAQTLHHAAPAAMQLPLLSLCTDPVWLTRRIAPPDGSSDVVATLRHRLADVHALESAGRYDDARAIAAEVLQKAEALAWLPLVAEARHALGLVDVKRGQFESAEGELVEAFLAAESSAHDELAAAAAIELVYVVGYRRARHEEGLLWGRQAEAWLSRLDQLEGRLASRLYNHLGAVHDLRGAHTEALADLHRALDSIEASVGPHHPDVAVSLNSIAIVEQARGQYDAAITMHERAIAIREAALGPMHPSVATSLTNLGNVERVRGAYDEARELYERSLAIRSAVLPPDHADVGTTYNNLGLLEMNVDRLELAREYFNRALAIRERALGPEHPDVATTLSNLGILAGKEDRFDDARAHFDRALAIREKAFGPEHPAVMMVLHNVAVMLVATEDLEGALAIAQRVRVTQERSHGVDRGELANTYNNIGSILSRLDRNDEALGFFEQALTIRQSTLPATHPEVRSLLATVARQLDKHGDREAAASRFDELLALGRWASEEGVKASLDAARVANALARPHAAIAALEEAVAICDEITAPSPLRATAGFELARALWKDRRDRERAIALARGAIEVLAEIEDAQPQRAEIEAWLRQRENGAVRMRGPVRDR